MGSCCKQNCTRNKRMEWTISSNSVQSPSQPKRQPVDACRRIPDAAAKVLGRIDAALALMAQLLYVGPGLPAGALIPLLRAAAAALTVDRLHLLHVQASGVVDALIPSVPIYLEHRS